MGDCRHAFLGTAVGPNSEDRRGRKFVRMDCKMLSCDHCGPKKAARYRFAIAEQATARKMQRFLTLTLDPKKIPEGMDSVSYLRDCWAKFRVYLGRGYGRISFISIVELQKNGTAHLHLLVGSYLPIEWVRQSWQAVGGGWMVWIERVCDLHHVGKYLSKYLTKELLRSVEGKKKRVSTSRDIKLFIKSKGWFRLARPIRVVWTRIKGVIVDHEFDDFGLKSFVVFPKEGQCLTRGV